MTLVNRKEPLGNAERRSSYRRLDVANSLKYQFAKK